MFYVYILYSINDNKLYTGFTNDLRKRVYEHNAKKVRATLPRAPLELIYYEAYANREDAKEREKYYKTGWGRKFVRKLLARTLRAKI